MSNLPIGNDNYLEITISVPEEKSQLALIRNGISVREIGNLADIALLNTAIPNVNVRNIPFGIRSLIDLFDFIENPIAATNESLCLPGAVKAWNEMGDRENIFIKERLSKLLQQYPSLLFSLKTLEDNWIVSETITDSIDYFRELGDDSMVDAIELCSKFLVD